MIICALCDGLSARAGEPIRSRKLDGLSDVRNDYCRDRQRDRAGRAGMTAALSSRMFRSIEVGYNFSCVISKAAINISEMS
jgi:hypothetical protein